MDRISSSLPSVLAKPTLPSSVSAPSTPSSEKLAKVAIAVDRIFKGRPETRIENPDYLDGLTETLEALTDQELAWVSDVRDGIQTRCKYLPTPADLFELIREKKARAEQFKPIPPRNVLKPDPVPADTDFEARKKQVLRQLGYNPQAKSTPVKRHLVPPTADDLAGLKSSLPPPGPPTRELLQYIAENPFPYREAAE